MMPLVLPTEHMRRQRVSMAFMLKLFIGAILADILYISIKSLR